MLNGGSKRCIRWLCQQWLISTQAIYHITAVTSLEQTLVAPLIETSLSTCWRKAARTLAVPTYVNNRMIVSVNNRGSLQTTGGPRCEAAAVRCYPCASESAGLITKQVIVVHKFERGFAKHSIYSLLAFSSKGVSLSFTDKLITNPHAGGGAHASL